MESNDEYIYQLLAPYLGQPMTKELQKEIVAKLPIPPRNLTYIVRFGILRVIKVKLQ